MFFDTHAHYDDESFDQDRHELLAKMPDSGVGLILDPGCDEASSLRAMTYAEMYPYVYAAVGWHPQQCSSFDSESPDKIRNWARNEKVRAIGEIGLDYYYDYTPVEMQREVFAAQMGLAQELGLPVIVHDRDAHGDSMDIVRAFPGVRGVFHCYSGSAEMARQLLDLGWDLSFTGAITFKNARRAIETIEMCPMDRIMIETDSPYLTPVPFRGRRNDSRMLIYIAEKIAQVKGLSTAEVERLSYENGRRFFGIE